MTKLKYIALMCVGFGAAYVAPVSALTPTSVRDLIYQYAVQGNDAQLLRLKRLGYSLDALDVHGNTAYCQAIWMQQRRAVRTLRRVGADRRPECLKSIPVVTAEMIYDAGASGDLEQLIEWKKVDVQVDVVDQQDENSALCKAVYDHDCKAIETLLRAGAKEAQNCMRRIPQSVRDELSCKSYVINWDTVGYTTLGLAATGGVVALLAGGAGGGGGGSGGGSSSGSGGTNLDKVDFIAAVINVNSCPTDSGMILLNGVCTCPKDKILINGVCTDRTESNMPTYFAENGASVTNKKKLTYTDGSINRIVAMQANGVKASALRGDRVYLNGASSAKNASSGEIIMAETLPTDGGLYGMYGTAAGTINNDGKISITSVSSSESAGMKVDRNDQYGGMSGEGANITNNGRISIKKQGDGTGTLSAVSAPGRGVTNNGFVDIDLATDSFDANVQHGTVQGIYGRSVANTGTITLNSDPVSATVNANVYMMRGYGDKGSVVTNGGKVDIDITNVAYGIYGVWSDKGTNVTVENTGDIDVKGILYNHPSISKQIYLVGSDSGISTVSNSGNIYVGNMAAPIDVTAGGILEAMYLNRGSMVNDGIIDLFLKVDPSKDSNTFSAHAMSLEIGNLVNNNDINYNFTNKTIADYTGTKPSLYLTGVEVSIGSAINNKNILANLTGYASEGLYTAMNAYTGDMTNNGKIEARSDIDNVGLSGLKSSGGEIINSEYAVIQLTTSGENADLTGGETGRASLAEALSRNDGYIYLIHEGGSGRIAGFSGTNNGYIQIQAENMTGHSVITGGTAYLSVYERATEERSEEETEENNIQEEEGSTVTAPTKVAPGEIKIALTGTTSGDIWGFEYMGLANQAPSHMSATRIDISADSEDRVGELKVGGFGTKTWARGDRSNDIVSVDRDGVMNVRASGSPTDSTMVTGIYAENADVINSSTSVVNVHVDLNGSTAHFISGMMIYDSAVANGKASFYGGYKGVNEGTLNIDVDGNTATTVYMHEGVPFDVVGMVTNSYALNTGRINLDVESNTAKTAGMVAYDGGIIINQGIISFTGVAGNFTPMYATGERTLTEKTESETSSEDKDKKIKTTTTTTTNYYATLYNTGKIVISNVTTNLDPKGEGYYSTSTMDTCEPQAHQISKYSTAEEVWARTWTTVTKKVCTGEDCKEGDSSIESESKSTLGYFEHFSTLPSPSITLTDGMKYVASVGGTIESEGTHFVGEITAGTDLVQGANLDTYLAVGQGEGALVCDGNYTDLGVASESALFTASYAVNEKNQNGIDIVLTRQAFTDLIKDGSVARFLENNYVKGNNVAFYDRLKVAQNITSLTSNLNQMLGKNMLTQFNFENMTMMKELNFNMNDKLFHNQEKVLSFAGSVSPLAFRSDANSGTKYSLYNKRSGKTSVGLGVAFTKLHSTDRKDNRHDDMMYQLIVPVGYQTHGVNLMISPRLGYARGSYDRTGFDNRSYEGTIERRIFGLMNEARYPIAFGKFGIEPAVELNALGYEQKGRETKKEFSLNIPSQRTYSLESGVGLYVTHETELSKDSKFKFTAGVAAYHEFADPYKLNVGMTGMDGSFMLRDENHSDNHAVARAGFSYDQNDYTLYGSFISYFDKEVRSKVNLGLNWNF